MGLPVIATNIGGSVDQVAEGETGFLVPPADPAALADRIERMLLDPEMRARMGAAGPKRVASRFTLEAMVHKLQAVYHEILSPNGS
jgi:glycosyltransferase involved in cell wall biosynthesis